MFKRHGNGKLLKLKSHMVVAGWWLERGAHHTESHSGMGPWSDIMDMECAAVNIRLKCYETDLFRLFTFLLDKNGQLNYNIDITKPKAWI